MWKTQKLTTMRLWCASNKKYDVSGPPCRRTRTATTGNCDGEVAHEVTLTTAHVPGDDCSAYVFTKDRLDVSAIDDARESLACIHDDIFTYEEAARLCGTNVSTSKRSPRSHFVDERFEAALDDQKCVPAWARHDQVLAAVCAQASIDVSTIFGPQGSRSIDIAACFESSLTKRKKRKHRPSGDDLHVVIIAADDLPRTNDAGPLEKGSRYEVVMSGLEAFDGLCRHYAAYHTLHQSKLAFKLASGEPDLCLSDTPFKIGAILDLTIYSCSK